MKLDEAKAICQAWFDHNEAQRVKSVKIQRLATLARTDPKEARRQMAQIDRQPIVYDGGRLEPAVRFLLDHIERAAVQPAAAQCDHDFVNIGPGGFSVPVYMCEKCGASSKNGVTADNPSRPLCSHCVMRGWRNCPIHGASNSSSGGAR